MQILQTPNEFLKDFVLEINNAKQSVQIQSMNFETGKVMSILTKALISAAGRGVKIEINFDWVSQRYVHDTLPIFPVLSFKKRKYIKNLHMQNEDIINKLTKASVKMNQTNKPFFPLGTLPFMGRNHIKMYIVDKDFAWIGGLNLFDISFENVDFMVKITDKKIIDALSDQFKKINKNKALFDYSIKFDENYSLTIDAGNKMKSLIYDQALNAVKESKKSVVFMSQFVPDGKILKVLINCAKRGAKIDVITSPKDNKLFTRYPEKLSYLYFKRSIKKYPNVQIHYLPKTVHAKLILIDDKKALFGSHNFTYSGVALGTEEIMIETSDMNLIAQIRKFVDTNLKKI